MAYRPALRRMALAFLFSSRRISSASSSTSTCLLRWAKLVDAILLSASTFLFSPLGTCLMKNPLKVLVRFLTFSKYLILPGSFAMLAIKASYSASLLIASNLNLRAYVNFVPSRLVSIWTPLEPSTHDMWWVVCGGWGGEMEEWCLCGVALGGIWVGWGKMRVELWVVGWGGSGGVLIVVRGVDIVWGRGVVGYSWLGWGGCGVEFVMIGSDVRFGSFGCTLGVGAEWGLVVPLVVGLALGVVGCGAGGDCCVVESLVVRV
ncbi:hypothetical protein Tco_1405851 [Tanacetum coccineum]